MYEPSSTVRELLDNNNVYTYIYINMFADDDKISRYLHAPVVSVYNVYTCIHVASSSSSSSSRRPGRGAQWDLIMFVNNQ